MDRLTELELFVKVAEVGSVSRAAEALGLSNPAASRHLAALEGRLKTRLVERNTRRLYLTSEGQDFHERARTALTELQDAEAALHSSTLNPSGVLRVSASLSFSMQQIAPRLPQYHQRYPKVRVHIEAANRYLDMIENGIDVAIRNREFEPDSSITIRKLASTRRLLCASPAYLAARGTPQEPEDLARHDFLIYVLANHAHELRLSNGAETRVVGIQGLLESNDGQVLRAAALGGLGILVQPSYIVYDDIVAGRLVPLLNDWDLPRIQINIAYPSRKHLSAKVRSFIDFMAEEFARNDYERKWTSYLGLK
ncbi:DNA-binding transcriptional LysR family regulator [Acidovorax soli]|uniref:DNA-binding transcriptional LysR family regulator n=1 Tax=Acidovorax soli TaxID=592050 RepID=A0A7X0UCB7_9BURK|nr:LysR family transcriptional regulator [Acidovorax soli]MBB6562963.1 DNA-binding transcriptional LysR family regulator [Acidovorax soli]